MKQFFSAKLHNLINSSDDFITLAKLFKDYFKKFVGQYAILVILIVISSAATGASAWYVRDVVNLIFVEKKYDLLYYIIFSIIALFTLRCLSMYFQSVLMGRISSKIVANVQTRIFNHVLRQRVRFFEKRNSDNLIMLINQGASAFNSILTRVVLMGARDIATVIGLFGVMLFQDPVLTLICAATLPLIYFGVNLLLRKIKELSEQELQSFVDLNRYMRETVQGARVIKAYNLQDNIRRDAKEVIRLLRHRTNVLTVLNEAPVPMLDALGGTAVGLAILYAGLRASYGAYDVGTFMSFLTALLLAADPGRRISQLRVNLRKSLIGVRMVHDFFKEEDPEPEGIIVPPPQTKPAIHFRKVRFAYHPGIDVLDGIDLDVEPGETVALVGPSGAGKSTIFSLLLKFYDPSDGMILIGGHDIREWNTHALRNNIAYVGQSNFIFTGSVEENLSLGRTDIPKEQLDAVCEAVGLRSFIETLPRGYATPIGELGSSISGGQAQRLNIARAILKDAPILLLDEVTSALDAENEALIKAYVASQRGSKTILIIAHRLSTVRDADRIVVLDQGRLTAAGRHGDLIETNPYYKRVVSLQLVA